MKDINWLLIRPIHGSRQTGFEELCAQLAEREVRATSGGASFVRNAPPDAGVECYATFPDGSEWGWQAKYFTVLGSSQWNQIESSVKAALEKHPGLVRYYICVPLDLPDPRGAGQRSARRRWNEKVQRWKAWATDRGMCVEFDWWGSHELLSRLMLAENRGLVRYFFDIERFDDAWFESRLNEALKSAGARYTPEVHIGLPIAAKFEAFGRTERFFDSVKSSARGVREASRSLGYTYSSQAKDLLDTADSVSQVLLHTQQLVTKLAEIEPDPVGELPFLAIAHQADQTIELAKNVEKALLSHEEHSEGHAASDRDEKTQPASRETILSNLRYTLRVLQEELRKLKETLEQGAEAACSTIMLLTGEAGIGKTHLMCDVAKKRISEGRPTVILMGQRFTSCDEPWTQALQQLDLRDLSVEEFVEALEAAARAAGCRALVMIDALNEGAGRRIWPVHLAAFLEYVVRSPWIGVVLAVRSSFVDLVVPEEIRKRAVLVRHQGFAGCEYDAARAFFAYYGIEFPSTPLLRPEFSNPLFLKILCQGLQRGGQRRLPKGIKGITAIFKLFLDAVNDRLGRELGFDPRRPLVDQALKRFAREVQNSGDSWLSAEEAERLVNEVLPGRDFEQSLYFGLVNEGILVEDVPPDMVEGQKVIVFFAYDRLADHLKAEWLLDMCLADRAPSEAFSKDGPLGFLWGSECYVSPGLLEALCIQVPERTGQELLELIPAARDQWEIGRAFRESIIWRHPEAFTSKTLDLLYDLARTESDVYETFDVLLSVATVPEHPLNAEFLHRWLREYAMADRDACWSTYLHYSWGSRGPVDRLVDWASAITPDQEVEPRVVELGATALAWMLTSSNRFLRDRATKALVSLLTSRLGEATKLVERFADVDDPYVAERVYAVAYGTAMRSNNPKEVAPLATCVYHRVFSDGAPPPHILLRDYARGVVERALHLGAEIDVEAERIRPPYPSTWPTIPTEEQIQVLFPDRSGPSYDSGCVDWARYRIVWSVMADDFAQYVIGTNSRSWLSLSLDEPPWQSRKERLAALTAEFSEEEREAWEAFERPDETFRAARAFLAARTLVAGVKDERANGSRTALGDRYRSDLQDLRLKRKKAWSNLKAVLTKEHAWRLIAAMKAGDRPPSFDLRLIQRYILWRVFDLGWTTERFGRFDRFAIGYRGRAAHKAERIGKKYQWIAYHEIMALVADHFQYCEQFLEDNGRRRYEGPWQESFRDIDPSCTLRSVPGRTRLHGHSPAWWGPTAYDEWNMTDDYLEWVKRYDDLPSIADLLIVRCPKDGSRWANLQGYLEWQPRLSPDQEPTDVERREVWSMFTGYLVRRENVDEFMKWARNVDSFWGRWMPEPPKVWRMFLGEYGWSPAFRYFHRQYYRDDEWVQLREDCPVGVKPASFEYLRETSGFDCSIDESYTLRLPAVDLVNGLGLRWTGSGADFVNAEEQLTAFDPTAHEDGPNALLVRLERLTEFLERERLVLCWTVLGEKLAMGPGFAPSYRASLQVSGACKLDETGRLEGFLKYFFEGSEERAKGSSTPTLIAVRRIYEPG